VTGGSIDLSTSGRDGVQGFGSGYTSVTNLTVEKVDINGVLSGVNIGSSDSSTIRKNNMTNLGARGILLSSSPDSVIENNRVETAGTGFTGTESIEFGGDNITVSGNVVDEVQTADAGIDGGPSSSNAVISDNTVNDTQGGDGILVGGTNSIVDNNTVTNAGANGTVVTADSVNLTDNNITNAGANGVAVDGANNADLVNNTINSSTSDGIETFGTISVLNITGGVIDGTTSGNGIEAINGVTSLDNLTVDGVTVNGTSGRGINILGADSVAINNTVSQTGALGIFNSVGNATNNTIRNVDDGIQASNAVGNDIDGTDFGGIESSGNGGVIRDNTVNNTDRSNLGNPGIRVNNDDNTEVINNTVTNGTTAVEVDNAVGVPVEDTTVREVTDWALEVVNGGNVNATNLDVGNSTAPNTNVSITSSSDFAVAGNDTANSVADPAGPLTNIGRYFNATNTSASGFLNVTLNYSDSDLGALNESRLRILRYNGTDWTNNSINNLGVDTTNNGVSANISAFSTFGAFSKGVADSVQVETNPDATQTAGQALTGPPRALATNSSGGPVANVTVSVNAINGSGTVNGTLTNTTNSSGIAEFNNLFINTSDTGYKLNLSIDGADADVATTDNNTTTAFEVTNATPANVTATPQTDTAVANGTDTVGYTVTVEDEFGNPVPGEGVNTTDNGTNVGYPSGQNKTTNSSGQVVISANSTDAQTVQFTFTEQSALNNFNTSIGTFGAADADKVEVEQNPAATQTAGQVISPSPIANVTDPNDNAVSGVTVTAQAINGSGTLDGTLTNTTNSSGFAEFGDLFINTSDTGYQINFSIDGADAGVDTSDSNTTTAFDVNPNDPANLTAQNETTVAGDTDNVTVTVEDTFGNRVPGDTVNVAADDGLTFDQTMNTTNSSGVATLQYTETNAGTYHPTIQNGSGAISDTATVVVTAGDADTVTTERSPNATQTAGQVISPSPIANVTDPNGNAVQGANVTVQAVNGSGTVEGTLTNQTNSSGLAEFGDLFINTSDTGYRIEFSIDSSDSNVAVDDTSQTSKFDVQPATPDNVIATVDVATASPDGSDEIQFTVTVTDEFGNAVQDGTQVNTTDNGTDISYAGDDAQTTTNGQVVVTATSTTTQSDVPFTFEEQVNNNNDTALASFGSNIEERRNIGRGEEDTQRKRSRDLGRGENGQRDDLRRESGRNRRTNRRDRSR